MTMKAQHVPSTNKFVHIFLLCDGQWEIEAK